MPMPLPNMYGPQPGDQNFVGPVQRKRRPGDPGFATSVGVSTPSSTDPSTSWTPSMLPPVYLSQQDRTDPQQSFALNPQKDMEWTPSTTSPKPAAPKPKPTLYNIATGKALPQSPSDIVRGQGDQPLLPLTSMLPPPEDSDQDTSALAYRTLRGLAGLGESLTTPSNLAAMALTGGEGVIGKAAGTYFRGSMLADAAKQVPEAYSQYKQGQFGPAYSSVLQGALSGMMGIDKVPTEELSYLADKGRDVLMHPLLKDAPEAGQIRFQPKPSPEAAPAERPFEEPSDTLERVMRASAEKPSLLDSVVDKTPPYLKALAPDEARSQRIANYYESEKSAPQDPEVQKAYSAFNQETHDQFELLKASGYTFTPSEEAQTYPDSGAMADDVLKNKHLTVWTGGTPEHGLMTPQQNFEFRAVHDVYGHSLGDPATFGHAGEEGAYAKHYQMYSPDAQKALATETRRQNATVHFGEQTASDPSATYRDSGTGGSGLNFPEQKALILPHEMRWTNPEETEGLGLAVKAKPGAVPSTPYTGALGPRNKPTADIAAPALASEKPMVVERKDGNVVVNMAAQSRINALFGVPNGGAVTIPVEGFPDVRERIASVLQRAGSAMPPEDKKFATDLVAQLDRVEKSGQKSLVINPGDVPISQYKTNRRHEIQHQTQFQLGATAPGGIFISPYDYPKKVAPIKTLNTIASRLTQMGYDPERVDSMAMESGAYIASGDWDRMGLTEAQGKQFYRRYLRAMIDTNGLKTVEDATRNLHPEIRRIYDKVTAAAKKSAKSTPATAVPTAGGTAEQLNLAYGPEGAGGGSETDLGNGKRRGGGVRQGVGSDVPPGKVPAFVKAFHGSPHVFDEFDASKIGTGQGAQSYGHGLYFAENPSVAKSYAPVSRLEEYPSVEGQTPSKYKVVTDMFGYGRPVTTHIGDNYDEAVQKSYEFADHWRDPRVGKVVPLYEHGRNGAMYSATIPDEHVAKMLDWDKPLSEQNAVFDNLSRSLDPEIANRVESQYGGFVRSQPGQNVHETLTKIFTNQGYSKAQAAEAVSAALDEAGIPGIKYLDRDSRATGQGTRNLVVFDPKILKDVSRNGSPIEERNISAAVAFGSGSPLDSKFGKRFGALAPEQEPAPRRTADDDEKEHFIGQGIEQALQRAQQGSTMKPEDLKRLVADERKKHESLWQTKQASRLRQRHSPRG